MKYTLTDRLDFGRYKGTRIVDLFTGCKYPTGEFIQDFISQNLFILNDWEDWEGKETLKCKCEVKSFEFLYDNHIRIDIQFIKGEVEDFIQLVNPFFWCFEIYPEKEMFLSGNDFIRQANKKRNKNYQYSSDTDYIFWCIAKAKKLDFALIDFESLQELTRYTFRGIKFTHVEDNIFKYETDLVTSKRKIPQRIIDINLYKLRNKGNGKGLNKNYSDSDYSSP